MELPTTLREPEAMQPAGSAPKQVEMVQTEPRHRKMRQTICSANNLRDPDVESAVRAAQSWCPGTGGRGELRLPVRFDTATVSDHHTTRTFGGIETSVALKMPTIRMKQQFQTMCRRRSMSLNRRTKVVAFVNSKSGGQVGEAIMRALSGSLGQLADKAMDGEVCDLSSPGEPVATINRIVREVSTQLGSTAAPDVRLMVCGGDGTVTWILTALEQCEVLHDRNRSIVLERLPVGIVPLGTGNDLARSLGWGGTLRRVSDILSYLLQIVEADPVPMDQWMLVLRPHERLPASHKLRTCGSHPQLISDEATRAQLIAHLQEDFDGRIATRVRDDDEIFAGYWQNYFSVGMDARITGAVEHARQAGFGRCLFRWGLGKLCYGWKGCVHSWSRVISTAVEHLKLTSDGEDPRSLSFALRGAEGRLRQLMFLNINSYSAGLQVLPEAKDAEYPPSPSDEVMEVLSVRNVFGACGIFFGCSRARYWASAERATFSLADSQPMQADGEPWFVEGGSDILIQHHRRVTMLRAPKTGRFWKGHIRPDFWDELASDAE